IDMKLLKASFERKGMVSVITYINSGNVVFTDMKHKKEEIVTLLEDAILEDFQLNIKVLIRSIKDFEPMMSALPESWKNDDGMKSDVLFLWDQVDREEVLTELVIKPGIDTVLYVPGAILWAVD